MSDPKRIQRKRTKGWRMPEGAVYVGRPSRWGNPYRVGDLNSYACSPEHPDGEPMDAQGVVDMFRVQVEMADIFSGGEATAAYRELAGRDLACWCPPDQPCHADVLLSIANGPAPAPSSPLSDPTTKEA